MIACCISDTHSLHDKVKVPECDVLFHAGDFTGNGSVLHLLKFRDWFAKQPAEIKICIAGNHDEYAEREPELTKNLFAEAGVIYLQDESYILPNGMKVYGTPFTPEFFNWHFMHPRFEMYDKVWSRVPNDTNILLTHGPAYGLLDYVDNTYNEDHHVGCVHQLKRLGELKQLKLLISGHIHAGYGTTEHNGIKIVNASSCNEQYNPNHNKPIKVVL